MADIADNERKCALYVRVSTINQAEDGESLDEQVQTLKSYCAYRKWQDCTVYCVFRTNPATIPEQSGQCKMRV